MVPCPNVPNSMLNPSDRDRIRAEEIFRDEVRRELEKNRPKSVAGRMWDLVDSAFGRWAVTTVLAGLATWAFTTCRDSGRAEQARLAAIRRLDTEIATRLDRLTIRLPMLRTTRQFANALDALDRPAGNLFASNAFPEYLGRSLLSSLRELREAVKDPERIGVDKALRASSLPARIGAQYAAGSVDLQGLRELNVP